MGENKTQQSLWGDARGPLSTSWAHKDDVDTHASLTASDPEDWVRKVPSSAVSPSAYLAQHSEKLRGKSAKYVSPIRM